MSSEPGRIRLSDLMYLAAGVADVALATAQVPLQRLHAQLRRSDLAAIAGEGQDDLRIRGKLAIQRMRSESHMELLAQRALAERAKERRNGDGGGDTDDADA